MKLAEEDPTFKTYTDEETGQTIIAGMGELHLEIIVDRLLREFKVEANVGAPQVAYKETIRKNAVDQDTKYARQSGGKGQYGHVKITCGAQRVRQGLRVRQRRSWAAPSPRSISPPSTPVSRAPCRPACWPAIPVVDVKVTLYDGSYHEVDSSEMAFKIAGSMAFKEACRKADPVAAGAHHEGCRHRARRVYGRRHRRPELPAAARSRAWRPAPAPQQIDALVPLAEMFGYATDLRSPAPRAAASTPWSPSHYVEIPKSIAGEDHRTSGTQS